jgi:hypothetical protein
LRRLRRSGTLRRNGWARRSSGFLILFLLDGLQHVAGFGNLRPVDFRLRLLGSGRRRTVAFAAFVKMGAQALGFVILKRTRMRFLLSHTDGRECLENRSAFHFQFPR